MKYNGLSEKTLARKINYLKSVNKMCEYAFKQRQEQRNEIIKELEEELKKIIAQRKNERFI